MLVKWEILIFHTKYDWLTVFDTPYVSFSKIDTENLNSFDRKNSPLFLSSADQNTLFFFRFDTSNASSPLEAWNYGLFARG